MTDNATVKVPAEVLAGLEAVRDSGETNMYDRRMVMFLANEKGFFKTVVWINRNKEEYVRGIRAGFEAEDE